jgi:hypothetical protein
VQGRRLWRAVLGDYVPDEHELVLLRQQKRAANRSTCWTSLDATRGTQTCRGSVVGAALSQVGRALVGRA